jgi:hypothetical protein
LLLKPKSAAKIQHRQHFRAKLLLVFKYLLILEKTAADYDTIFPYFHPIGGYRTFVPGILSSDTCPGDHHARRGRQEAGYRL